MNEGSPEIQPPLGKIEKFEYDNKYGHFPPVIKYKGVYYDARDINDGLQVYRMTSEHRYDLPEPSYIEVNKKGEVIKEWN